MAMAIESELAILGVDPILFHAIVDAVNSCLTMCDTTVRCVGVSCVPTRDTGLVTGMIGVHGSVSGYVTLNIAEPVARSAVAGLLQERCDSLTSQVVDGVGEITNIIAGGIKRSLTGTPWGFSQVTIPSIIVGQNYHIAYAKGLNFLCVVFEHESPDTLLLDDRLVQVSVSLIRL
ncbi:MAG: chemotaxis protein CheX [Pirellulaceae bacterium]